MEKKKKMKLSAAERRRRSENMKLISKKRSEDIKIQKTEEAKILRKEMPVKDKIFADLYVWGDSKFQGNPGACYLETFGEETDIAAGRKGRKLVTREHMAKYIDKQMAQYDMLMKAEKIKNIQTLTKIRDEMATASYVNRFGEINGVAACRSVAIKASETLNGMLGFEKPKELNVNHGAGIGGITFNLIVPSEKSDDDIIDISHEEMKEINN